MIIANFDPNVRVWGNSTYVGYEGILNRDTCSIRVGATVVLIEPETHLEARGAVRSFDEQLGLIIVDVDWQSLHVTE